ncbi:hypothetical protein [Anoxybacteroides rupiense]|uniref:hypothetical protein n=1 Tax=Anoxybacteroides rupiense TaxID=311460 RepID=UPI00366E3563
MIELFMPILMAGILTDAFGKLFDVIWSVIKWIGRLLKKLFQGLIDLLVSFFEVIYALIDGLLYFLYKIGVLAVKLFMLFFELAKLIVSLFVGFAKTLASLVYIPRGSSGNGYSEMLGKIFNAMKPLQLDPIAYILLFILWMFTVVAAIKLLSSIRVGGD